MSARVPFSLAFICAVSRVAFAQPTPAPSPASPDPGPSASAATASTASFDDGYCDFVEGTASANAATLYAPELFGQFGYIEQPAFAVTPGTDTSNLRIIGGIRWSLTNIVAGAATKSLARADCKRHNALAKLRQVTDSMRGGSGGSAPLALAAARALSAKLRVYSDAQKEADRILADVTADLEAKRTTAPDAIGTRMRVEDLRSNAADIQTTLAALPPEIAANSNTPLSGLLEAYTAADAQVEKSAARLRSIRAYDVSVRGGVDQFLDSTTSKANYFAVVQVGINLGALWTGSGNKRAARGRKQFAASEMSAVSANVAADQAAAAATTTTPDQIRAVLEIDKKRVQQVTGLVVDLDQQLAALAQIPGDDSKRFRQTIWFDSIKAKAELAYLQAHMQALGELLGGK
jgi:hypothetical protein